MPHQILKHKRMLKDYKEKNKMINIYTKNINRIISTGIIRYNTAEYNTILMYIKKINKINKLLWRTPISIDSFIKNNKK